MIKKPIHPYLLLKALLPLFIISIFSHQLKAQSNKDYSLLWEIKGNGLTKPSYIFGAISLRDHRAFNFSDSVFIAIANSSVFALENHPDSIAKYLKVLPKNLKYSTAQNPPKMEFKGASETYPTHFLYGTARTLKKNFYGLSPDIEEEEQLETEEIDEEQNEDMEALLSIYAKGNLNDIHGEILQYYEDNYFDERSTKLAASIIDLIKKETVFASVAVALLPGENGILAKLRKAGYQVRPVGASFTDLPKTYAIDFEKMNWQTYNDKAFHFSIKFPSTPAITNNGQMKAVSYQDPVNYVGYTATAIYTGPLADKTPEQYVDTILARFTKNRDAKIITVNKYQKHGSTMLEAVLQTADKFSKTKLIHVNGTFYSFTIESEKDISNEPFCNLFLNSIEINEPTAISQNDWVDFKSLAGGFTVKLPIIPQEVNQQIENPNSAENPYFINIFLATDKTALINYIVRYSDYPNGMYLADKDLVLNNLLKDFENKGEIVVKPHTIVENGIEGKSLDLIASNSYMQIKVFIKGNRTYIVLKQNMNGPTKPKEDIFFKTFNIKQDFNTNSIPFVIGNLSINSPAVPKLLPKSKEDIEDQKKGDSFLFDAQTYFTLNKNTGGVYGIEKSTISKYYKQNNPDTLLYTLANKLSNNAKIEEIVKNGYKALAYVTTDSLAGTTKRSRIWFEGNSCYIQTLIADKDEIESPIADTFFNTVKLNKTQALFDFKSSKAKLIVDDLASLHQPTHQLALGAISFYNFEKDELPHLYTALKQKYTDDTTTVGTRYVLLEELEELNDEQTVPLLKNLYQDSKGLDLIQSKILATTPYVDSKSYDWYFKTLTEAPVFDIENHWGLFNPLSDSLTFTAANFDKVLKIGQQKAYRPMVLDLISTMINADSSSAYLPIIEANADFIKKYAISDLDEDIILINDGKYTKTTNYYLSILPKLNLVPLTDDFTKKLIALDSVPYIKTNAVANRILKNLAVEQAVINAQLDSLQSRYVIMRAFHDAGKINVVPMKYREHSEFAKLLLSDFLAEEYDYPSSINLLGSLKEEGKVYYACDFTYLEEGEKKTYIGIAGPFDEEKNILKFGTYGAYSNFDLKDKDWMKQAKALIQIFNSDE